MVTGIEEEFKAKKKRVGGKKRNGDGEKAWEGKEDIYETKVSEERGRGKGMREKRGRFKTISEIRTHEKIRKDSKKMREVYERGGGEEITEKTQRT